VGLVVPHAVRTVARPLHRTLLPLVFVVGGSFLVLSDVVSRTIVAVADSQETHIGGRGLAIIAGPCSVENLDMLRDTARAVRAGGARLLRGGAFKPRTSPYAFQGLGAEALEMLAKVRAETGLPVVTEVMDPRHVLHHQLPGL